MNDALRWVIQAYLNDGAWAEFAQKPPTLFHGVPGLVYALGHSRTIPPSAHNLEALRGRVSEAMAHLDLKQIPDGPGLHSLFFGARGVRWALDPEATPLVKLGPPPSPYGFDAFINDAPLLYGWVSSLRGGVSFSSSLFQAWAGAISHEWEAMEDALSRDEATLLGLAHGVTGVAYSALLLWQLNPELAPVSKAQIEEKLRWLRSQAIESEVGLHWPARRGGHVGPDTPFVGRLCNGAVGHGLLFLDAAMSFERSEWLDVALGALEGIPDEATLPLSVCCGHGGKVALVSRFLRLGHGEALGGNAATWERLLGRIPTHAAQSPLSGISGLGSLFPALSATGPGDPRLDYLLPSPLER